MTRPPIQEEDLKKSVYVFHFFYYIYYIHCVCLWIWCSKPGKLDMETDELAGGNLLQSFVPGQKQQQYLSLYASLHSAVVTGENLQILVVLGVSTVPAQKSPLQVTFSVFTRRDYLRWLRLRFPKLSDGCVGP